MTKLTQDDYIERGLDVIGAILFAPIWIVLLPIILLGWAASGFRRTTR